MAQKKTLVILGGGLGGLPLAKRIEEDRKLSQALDVILVDKKEYYEINLASPRFLVLPEQHANFSAPYTSFLKKTRFVQGSVRTVQSQPQQIEVEREGGVEYIPYDFLVISLGTRYPYFKAEASLLSGRVEEVMRVSQQIRNSDSILIVGGRSVGVEVVGEILSVYPQKKITLVHPSPSLMDGWPKSGLKKLNKFMSQKGKNVNVILGKKFVRSTDDTHHELSDGSIVEADMKIFATGNIPNSEPLRPFFSSSLSPSGYVKVRETLQLEGFGNIFAFGDIADIENHPKMAANLKGQVEIVLKNITSILNNKKQINLGNPLAAYPGLVTLGPTYAILALPVFGGSSFDGKMLSNMKTGIFTKAIKNP